MANSNLQAAKKAKNDEFYTMYEDIEKEMNAYIEYNKDVFRDKIILLPCDDPEWSNFTKYFAANFERLGLKKLISTSYAKSSGNNKVSDLEKNSPKFDKKKNKTNGKLFILEKDINKSGKINYEDIEFEYLEGDGDFRSEEVTKLRDEADVIITNPPFSLFREFVSWIMEANKQFIIVGSKNAITYKEIFPLIKENKLWIGNGFSGGNAYFKVPEGIVDEYAEGVYDKKTQTVKFRNCSWFTNIDHGKRHEPLQLMTMADNIKYNKKLIKNLPKDKDGKPYYPKYDNYDGLEVPVTDGLPSDYKPCWYDCQCSVSCPYALTEGKDNNYSCEKKCNGIMGLPITCLDKYNPDMFKIVDINPHFFSLVAEGKEKPKQLTLKSVDKKDPYARILIRLCK